MPSRTSTQNCHQYGHAEFSVQCDETPFYKDHLAWLVDWLERQVASGKLFLHGQSVQVGWSLLKVKARPDGTLSLWEPDYQSMPIKFVDSVSQTLLHLFLQKSVAESLDPVDDLEFPSLMQSAIACTRFRDSGSFVMDRKEPKNADSGWFLGCADRTHDHQRLENLQRVSLYEAALGQKGRIIPFLGLSAGTYAEFAGAIPFFSKGDQLLVIRPGSYLHQRFIEGKTPPFP